MLEVLFVCIYTSFNEQQNKRVTDMCDTTNQLTFKQHLTTIYPQDKQILLSYNEYELMCLYSSSYTKYLGDTK